MKDFKTYCENQESHFLVLATMDGYSYGVHADHYEDEVPADDPFESIKFDFNYPLKNYLGREAMVFIHQQGSYHEQFLSGHLILPISQEESKNKNYWDSDLKTSSNLKQWISPQKFIGTIVLDSDENSLVQKIKMLSENNGNLPKSHETSQDYWNRIMTISQIKNKNISGD